MTLRFDIRKETDPFHKLAESATDKYAPLHTEQGYKTFLLGMSKVYQAYGTALDASSLLIGIKPRSHEVIASLKKDLGSSFQENPSLSKEFLHHALTKESYLGIAYALEGSALGSKIILQRIADSNFKNHLLSYLSLLTNQSPTRWPKTLKALNDLESDHHIVIESAQNVFKFVAKAMKGSYDRSQ